MRFFLANSKADGDAAIDHWTIRLKLLLEALLDEPVEVINGRDDYQNNAKEEGGWKPWINGLHTRTGIGGSYYYDGGLILPVGPSKGLAVGKATAQMIEAFLSRDDEPFVAAWNTEEEDFRIGTGDVGPALCLQRDDTADITNIKRIPVPAGGKAKWDRWATVELDGINTQTGRTKKPTGTSYVDTSTVDTFIDACDNLLGILDEIEAPAAEDFVFSVRETAESMKETAMQRRFVSQKMINSIDNMTGGASRWIRN
jgi:hypothetical protein